VADKLKATAPYPGPVVTGEPNFPAGCFVLSKAEVQELVGYPIVGAAEREGPPRSCAYSSSKNDFEWDVYGVTMGSLHEFELSAIRPADSWTQINGYPVGIVAVERRHPMIGWQVLFYVQSKRTMGVCGASGYNGVLPPRATTRNLCREYATRLAPLIK
jgi:hypothetical protein